MKKRIYAEFVQVYQLFDKRWEVVAMDSTRRIRDITVCATRRAAASIAFARVNKGWLP